ncbi:glycosyl transferase [Ureibacillus massiliensis 4400831 = CIP 108448 = CCUG 49529]|uniref:Glycosyl transferase n=1 Tax=Ureibacillus massiliensis 4400831 = CIP 108448 = CCUG 49529 TaxID=1211035 RepID=A0A0A3J591_9BACL|nr:glycosyltransferase [Ureibacillus massiliensis]KGR90293.1 glycosyl transferase [Ureibacillus massiliensis 4400831 = CIP 108448 = CCUG 49529]
MKKVLIISNMYPSMEHLSYGIFVKNQVEQLRETGIESLLAVNADPKTGKLNVLKKYAKWAMKVNSTFKKNKKDIGLTHCHYVFPSGLFSYRLKMKYGIPYVVTAHGGDINKMAKKGGRIREYTNKILQNADHIIAVGEELASDIQRDFGVEESRISVMSMGIDRKVFYKPASKEETMKQVNMDPNRTNFLFVGNIIQEKGVEELISAFNQLDRNYPDQVALYCVGSTKDTAFTERMKELAGASKNIHFIEPMPQNRLAEYFQAANVFVLPSYIEGLGLVALEAMSCGTPVIASDVGGLHYMLQDGAGVLVPPKDANALFMEFEKVVLNNGQMNVNDAKVDELLQLHDSKAIIARLTDIYRQYIK